MRNNETGEIELVVGNRQLLSGFFIVVMLCAVAFALGDVVGQNSPRSAKLADQASSAGVSVTPSDSRPAPASPPPPVANPAGATASEPPPTGAGTDLGSAAAPPPPPPPPPPPQAPPDLTPPPP